MINLRTTIEAFSQLAETVFDHKGKMEPTFFIHCQGEWTVMPHPPFPREMVIEILRSLLKDMEADAYVFINEAWCVEVREIPKIPPSEHPDRKEVVVISAENANRQLIGRRAILRPAGDKPSLAPLELNTKWTPVDGDMVGLMRPAKTVH
jgi:hypothetical protein